MKPVFKKGSHTDFRIRSMPVVFQAPIPLIDIIEIQASYAGMNKSEWLRMASLKAIASAIAYGKFYLGSSVDECLNSIAPSVRPWIEDAITDERRAKQLAPETNPERIFLMKNLQSARTLWMRDQNLKRKECFMLIAAKIQRQLHGDESLDEFAAPGISMLEKLRHREKNKEFPYDKEWCSEKMFEEIARMVPDESMQTVGEMS